MVDGVSVGAVTTYTFTSVIADHTITASFAIDTYEITGPQPGPTAPSPRPARPGWSTTAADQAFTITPVPGYHVADVTGGRRLRGRGHRLHLHPVTADHTITATFAIDTYEITVTQPAPTAPSPRPARPGWSTSPA